jgi:hypothetical protein
MTLQDKYFLSNGSHGSRESGLCAMEWVAYIAGEDHTDAPECVSPVLRTFAIAVNDRWDDVQRQKLRPYLARCIGTAGDGRDQERGWLAMDWLIRTFTPRFLDLCPQLAERATELRGIAEIKTTAGLGEAMVVLNEVRRASVTAGFAAGSAARDTAWAAAWDAGWDVARDAAWATGSAAVGPAAGAAAWAAAAAAAGAFAKPAVDDLRASTLDLLDRMLPTELIELPIVDEQVWKTLCLVA